MKLTWTQTGLLILLAAVLLLGMDWGLPSKERNELLTYGCELRPADFAALDSLNTDYFSARDTVDARAETALSAGSRPESHHATEVGAVLGRDEKLRGVRRFLLGSCAVDERKPFIALARMDPKRLDFDPRGFMYGGAYLYPLGFILKVAEVLRLTTLTADSEHALTHPRDVAVLYLAGRALGVAAFLGIGLLLVRLCAILQRPQAGTLALFAWCCSTLAINQALVAKPHLLAAFFSLLGLMQLLRFQQNASRRSLVWGGVFMGLAAGSSFPAAAMWLFVPVLIIGAHSNRRMLPDLALGLGCAAGAFLITNPYVVINPDPFRVTLWHHGASSGWGYAVLSLAKLKVFADAMGARGFAFPLSIAGTGALIFAIVKCQGALRLIAGTGLLLMVILGSTISNPRILLFLGPVFCLFSGIGLAWLSGSMRSARMAFVVAAIPCLAALPQLGLAARDFIDDAHWYRPTLEWVRASGMTESTTIGIFDRPEPSNHPPFPFLRSRVVNLDEYADPSHPPDLVILGNFADDRARWASHPLRRGYRLRSELGYRRSMEIGLAFRMRSESRTAGWVYERVP